jgi:hypothetical protein
MTPAHLVFRRVTALATAALSLGTASLLGAQKADARRWTGSVEASGNLLYGAASQRVAAGAAMLQRGDRSALYRFELQGGYGDARRPEATARSVIVRNVRFGTTIDLRRQDRVSPYTFATLGTSLQQRYSSRVDAGAGARMNLWRPDSVTNGFPEEATFSASILGEQTRPIANPSATAPPTDITRVRWSFRANYRKRISSALRLSHVTLYQPTVDDSRRLTLEATTVLSAPLYARTELTVTHRERIDSEAVERGAPSRRDGQLLFGVRTAF